METIEFILLSKSTVFLLEKYEKVNKTKKKYLYFLTRGEKNG